MSNLPPGTTQTDIDRAIEDAEPPFDFDDDAGALLDYPAEAELDALAARFDQLAADLQAFRALPNRGEECPF